MLWKLDLRFSIYYDFFTAKYDNANNKYKCNGLCLLLTEELSWFT